MIAIIDCDSCDTRGIRRAFDRLGVKTAVADSVEHVERATRIVIPASASLPRMIRSLRDRRLVGPIVRAAADGRPLLGISHGMHLLMDVSYEDGQHTGLGLVHGKVIRLDPGDHPAAGRFTTLHRGWNHVRWADGCPLTADLNSGDYFFFDHTFHAEPLDDRSHACAYCNHGIDFAAIIWRDRVFGTQFLPEESEDTGLTLLANFAAL